ncbi:MAG: hypothetical protein IPK26_17350 [Planctomycetes bacterium]|nr:hypothetical protein [Planctomycetota bacterium]
MRIHRTNLFLNLGNGTKTLIFGDRQTRIVAARLHELFGVNAVQPMVVQTPIALSIRGRGSQAGRHRIELFHEGLPPILVATNEKALRGASTLGALSPTGRWAVRNELISHLPTAIQPLASAFAAFDQATDWTGLTDPQRATMQAATTTLLNGVIRRAAWAGLAMTPPAALVGRGLPDLPSVEAAFRNALQAFHRPAPGAAAFDLAFFQEAFAGFVGSEFALRNLNGLPPGFPEPALKFAGVPDSSLFFCFAEAAFAFHAAGLNARFWQQLLPIFVAGARSFTEWYWDGTARHRHAYSGGPLAVAMPRAEQMALAAHYATMTTAELELLFGDIVRRALLAELTGIVPLTGPQPAHKVDLQYRLLRRISAVAPSNFGGPEPTGPVPVLPDTIDSGKFDQGTTSRELAIEAAVRSLDKKQRIDLIDDPDQQTVELLNHLRATFAGKTFSDPIAPAIRFEIKLCKGAPSVWNPDTKQCDPPDIGASLRLKVVRYVPGSGPCSVANADNNGNDTGLELSVQTANAGDTRPWP